MAQNFSKTEAEYFFIEANKDYYTFMKINY